MEAFSAANFSISARIWSSGASPFAASMKSLARCLSCWPPMNPWRFVSDIPANCSTVLVPKWANSSTWARVTAGHTDSGVPADAT